MSHAMKLAPGLESARLRTRRTRILVALATCAVPVLAWALAGSPFEGADGDLVSSTGVDWESFIGSPRLVVGVDAPTGQTDDALRGKEDDIVPGIDYGSIPNNKSDLLRFYARHDRVTSAGSAHDFLYLGWVRADALGTANMDFEFNQSNVLTANGVTVQRTPGDMLVTYGFSGGGNQVNLGLSRWTATGPCEASPSAPCWGPIRALDGIAEGAVNTVSSVVDPIAGETLPALTFGEAAIDLTAAGVFDTEACVSFGRGYVKSRSSDSFTSTLKDFIRPIDVRVTNCGTITVRKNAIPDSSQGFSFTSTPNLGVSSFVLDDDGSETNAVKSALSFQNRFDGTVSITEQPTTGWDLTGVSCGPGGTPQYAPDGSLTGEVVVDANPGDTIECSYTNTERGVIRVLESVSPAGDLQAFDFQLSGGPDAVAAAFFLRGGSAPFDTGAVRPGTYAIVQTDPGEAWDLESATCDDGSPVGALNVAPGEIVTCTFTNIKRGEIVIDEVTVPPGHAQAFPFTLTGGPDGTQQSFSLADAAAPYASGLVRSGTFAITQSPVPAGWDLTSATCDDGSAPGAVNVAPGESVHCTFTHTLRGTIVVDEITLPSNDPQSFSFTLAGGPDAVNQSFALTDATAPRASGTIRPGTYAVSQASSGAAWDLTSAVCSDGSAIGAVQLAAGETVTCTFTNTKRGTIKVDVVTTPSADPQTFGFSLTGGPDAIHATAVLSDTSPLFDSGLSRPGSYALAAQPTPAGWDLASASCSDASAPAAIGLNPGEDVVCTFAYVKRGTIRVDVSTLPAADPQSFAFSLTGGPDALANSFALTDLAAPYDSGAVRPGTYAVASGPIPADLDLVASSCSDGSLPGSVSLSAAESVTCTFTYTKRGRIVIDEITVPSGDPQAFAFALSGGPDASNFSFSLTDAATPYRSSTVRPGTYAASQTDPGEAWDPTGATCDDGSQPGSIALAPGETVTCTFRNAKRGHLFVDEITLPSGDPQSFAFMISGGPDAIAQAFSLTDAAAPHDSGLVRAGTFAIGQGALSAGWDFIGASCSDGSPVASVVVDPGESVTCTFRHTKRGHVVIVKDARPDSAQDFGFTVSGTNGTQTYLLDDDGNATDNPSQNLLPPSRSLDFAPGSYVASENAAGVMWDTTGLNCASSLGQAAFTIDLQTRSARFDLRPGETVSCTFVNTMRGRVIVRKVLEDPTPGVVYDPRQQLFNFTSGWGASFALRHNESYVGAWIAADRAYTVAETPMSPWIASSECVFPDGHLVSGGASISVTPPAGGEVVCTFTNAVRIHPGSSGFWKNWRNHYSDTDFRRILSASFAGSLVYRPLFDPVSGALRSDAIAVIDAIYASASGGNARKLITELTTTSLNLGVSTSADPTIRAFQMNDDITRNTKLNLSTMPGAEALIRSLAPCDIAAGVRIGDVIDITEAGWNGDIVARIYLFDALSSVAQSTLGNVFGNINVGSIVVVDPDSIPTRPRGFDIGGPVTRTWYGDVDGDGHGVPQIRTQTCDGAAPTGFASVYDDCDDAHAAVYPGAPEVCDGRRNDCSAAGWPSVAGLETDNDGDGYAECAGDCNDANAAVHPGLNEACNGVDDDCDGLIDNDALGQDTDGDGVRNLCDNCVLAVNPTQLDSDHDGIGDACDVCPAVSEKAQLDADRDGVGNSCDNCPTTSNTHQDDADLDGIGDACDNCRFDSSPSQSDVDRDGEGDLCDLNDGVIFITPRSLGDDGIEWQSEAGYDHWNVYKGSILELRALGNYTQFAGSIPLAEKVCGQSNTWHTDLTNQPAGTAAFYLVTGMAGSIEGSLGTNSSGVPRTNTNPCP